MKLSKLRKIIKEEIQKLNEIGKPKIKRGSGRGQSWTNYDWDNATPEHENLRMQITKIDDEYQAWMSPIPTRYGGYAFDLVGLSKKNVDWTLKRILGSNDPYATGIAKVNYAFKKFRRK